MNIELVTREDLQAFKTELVAELKEIMLSKVQTPKEWMKSAEIKQVLKISSGTLQNLRIRGFLKFSKIGGTYYYRYPELIKLMENGLLKNL